MRLMLLMLGLGLLLVGCGALETYPKDQEYRVVLQIADQDGNPLAGAAVWVDLSLMEERSAGEFSIAGQGFPSEWQGWQYNFASPTLTTRIDYEGDTDIVGVVVSKTGYRTQEWEWEVEEWSDRLFFRRVVIMEPLCPGTQG